MKFKFFILTVLIALFLFSNIASALSAFDSLLSQPKQVLKAGECDGNAPERICAKTIFTSDKISKKEVGFVQNDAKINLIIASSYGGLIPSCVKEGKYIEHDGIKICGPPLLQEMAVKALEKLKEKSPKDYDFVKENTVVIEESNYPGAAGVAVPNDPSKIMGVNTVLLRNTVSSSGKEDAINGLINTICHEAEHLDGGGEQSAYAKGAECSYGIGVMTKEQFGNFLNDDIKYIKD